MKLFIVFLMLILILGCNEGEPPIGYYVPHNNCYIAQANVQAVSISNGESKPIRFNSYGSPSHGRRIGMTRGTVKADTDPGGGQKIRITICGFITVAETFQIWGMPYHRHTGESVEASSLRHSQTGETYSSGGGNAILDAFLVDFTQWHNTHGHKPRNTHQ